MFICSLAVILVNEVSWGAVVGNVNVHIPQDSAAFRLDDSLPPRPCLTLIAPGRCIFYFNPHINDQ